MADATDHEIWADRATSLFDAMGVMSAPVHIGALCHFAQRKGWEQKTLEGVLAYAEKHGLVERYKAFDGKQAFKLTGTAVPTAPVSDTDPDEADEQPEADEAPPAATILDCLCARTAPHKNYGCPEHGGARITTSKETTDMAREWISTAEAAELLDCTKASAIRMAHQEKIEASQEGDGSRAPFVFKRSSVIAYRDSRAKKKAATDLLPATPVKRKAALVPPPEPRPQVRAAVEATPVVPAPAELADVRALVRIVDRCGIGKEAAWEWLRTLVAA